MRFAYASALLLPVVARAAYPAELAWSSNRATLEFCQDGSNYGYRAVGDTSACGSKPGPLIRMTPGQTYTLTLQNTASSSVVTNIHTHGLHIVGDGDSDNVLRSVEGGSCIDYTYEIPSDHPGGTYWYHPHYHTETNAQTGGGAFGMIIIEEPSTQGLTSWATSSGNEKLLLISNAGSLLGNGNSNEVLQVEENRWYRLRVSVVVPGAKPSDITFGSSCTVYKVASDGVWHNAAFTTYSGSSFELTGASRADFAIKCQNGDHAIKWGQGTAATIKSGLFGTNFGMSGDVSDLGSPPSKPESLNTDRIKSDTPATTTDISLSGAKINGATWGENGPGLGDIEYGKVHEWTISGSGAHPFHLHLYHMLVIDGCGAHEAGEFYDTISASGSCRVRFRTWDFGQKMILHCHVLQHEDNGAINFMNVVNVPSNLMNEVDAPSYTCSSAPNNPPSTTPPPTPPPTPTPLSPTPPTGGCLEYNAVCSADTYCCSNNCKQNGKCGNPPPGSEPTTAEPTASPTLKPTAFPTKAPTLKPTAFPTPPPTPDCAPSGSACPNGNSDCCSGNCNGSGTCRGNRYLRTSSAE